MPFEVQTAGDGVELILSGRLGVQQARALWDALQPAILVSQSIRLQAGELDEIDTSVIQILLLLSVRTGGVQFGTTSEGFVAALRGRGLEAFLSHSPQIPETPTLDLQPEVLAKAARQGHG